MLKIVIENKRFPGTGHNMGDSVPAPSTFEILYHRMQVTIDDQGVITIDYLDGSGIYTGYRRISDFITDLLPHIQQPQLLPSHALLYNYSQPSGDPAPPPDIVAKKACYIVISVESGNGDPSLCFRDDMAALQTAVDWSSEYRGLTRADSASNCKVVYFELFQPRGSGDDDYALFLQITDGTGTVKPKTVDPKIKNRGTRYWEHVAHHIGTGKKRTKKSPLKDRRVSRSKR